MVIKHDFHVCGYDCGAGAFVEKGGPVLLRDGAPCIVTEDEADGGEEVGFARAVATDDYIVARGELFDGCLVLQK